MIHLRIVVPADLSAAVLELLTDSDCVINLVYLEAAAQKPEGDVILCDVAREEASVLIGDLKHMGVARRGSIAVEVVDSEISEMAGAAERAAPGSPSDAVVWEEVESRTSENVELSASFLIFMVAAMLIASVGIMIDSPILIVGAMVVGPEFGPIAGLCVALVERRPDLTKRSLRALGLGFPVGILLAWGFTELCILVGLASERHETLPHPLTAFISHPDGFSAIVAVLAGCAGMLSLTTSKSGALVGVLISVTTIPAAANIGVAAAFGNWNQCVGAAGQLAVNLTCIAAAGVATLYVQRRIYVARRARHLAERA